MILEVRIKKLFLVLIILNFSCDTEPNYTVLKGSTFGTYYQIKFFEHDEKNPIIDKEIDSIFDHFNSSLSTYISFVFNFSMALLLSFQNYHEQLN